MRKLLYFSISGSTYVSEITIMNVKADVQSCALHEAIAENPMSKMFFG